MSRFDSGRWNRIMVWTGAALTWGTAVIAARLEPARASDAAPNLPAVSEDSSAATQTVMPAAPSQGLVILRFTPVPTPEPEIHTVYVERAVTARASGGGGSSSASSSGHGGGSAASAQTSPPPPAAQPAPAPSSSGS